MSVLRRIILSGCIEFVSFSDTQCRTEQMWGPIAFLVAARNRFVQSKMRVMFWYSNVTLDGKLKWSIFMISYLLLISN